MAGKEEAIAYMSKIQGAIGTKLIEKDGIYSGRSGHERFAREVGYTLNDFDEKGQEEILHGSYSCIYVAGCRLKPILDAKEWIGILKSQIKKGERE